MSSLTYYECFNSKLEEFIKDLTSTFPQFNDLKVLKTGIQLAKTMDVKAPQRMFNQYMSEDYAQKVLNKDEGFFLAEDYNHIAANEGIDVDIIPQIKKLWGSLEPQDKDAIWKYLQVLVLLNRKCQGPK